ncbi:YbaB/EbfC family nucleoid-associated protein [Nitrosophilus alvini]|uniref:YbaB/EbfC family nucleoid-associated protein n=1 Tax=Nitrosophilus alvini TaxID=2714855 RepID=UPI0019095FFE|nr:YbaB/EbfC family nucleoid-associated protein [Nitrosophilus alvini]
MFDKLNLGELGKVFEDIQEKAKKLQEESENRIFTAKSGGGLVKVSINGKGEVVDIEIDDSLLEDKESLQILLISAVNDALKMVEDEKKRVAMSLMGDVNPFGQK